MSGSYSLRQFIDKDWTPTEKIIDPWLPTAGISMLYAARGSGKTVVTLAMALHIAAGWRWLDMAVLKARRLLYIDGEMAADEVKGRLLKLEAGMGPFPAWTFENFRMLTHEDFENGIDDLATAGRGRRMVEHEIAEHRSEIVVLDNLSCLVRTGSENEAERWADFANWLLRFRRKGVTTLFIHHMGKDEKRGARGSTKLEDTLNSSIRLKTIEKAPILKLEWWHDKVRSFTPNRETRQIQVEFFKNEHGREVAARITEAQSMQEEVEEALRMQADGASLSEIAKTMGVSKATARRRVRKGKGAEGAIRDL